MQATCTMIHQRNAEISYVRAVLIICEILRLISIRYHGADSSFEEETNRRIDIFLPYTLIVYNVSLYRYIIDKLIIEIRKIRELTRYTLQFNLSTVEQ